MKPKLHDYQREAVRFCLQRFYTGGELGAGLFLDPGLGKTLITLTLLQQLRDLGEVNHVLIIAPLRVCRLVWQQEIDKWDFDFECNMLCQRVKKGLQRNPPFIELINYESLHLLPKHAGRWDMIVCDESTKIKRWTTKRMRSLRKLLPSTDKRLILTGTPAPNSLADLHSQVFVLDDGETLGVNVTVFRARYMSQGGWQGKVWSLRETVIDQIREQVAPLVLHMDAESYLDMPKLVTNDVYCELPTSVVSQYRKLKKELLAQLETGDVLAVNSAAAYIKMRQFANGNVFDAERNSHFVHNAKLDALEDLVGKLGGKPVLVFYQFSHDLEAIQTRFPKAKNLNGGTKKKEAEKLVGAWNSGSLPVFLVQNQSASHGINLQSGGSDIAYYGNNDSLEVYEQSYRRVYRQGFQGGQVRIHRLLTRNTVDEVIRDRLELKETNQRSFLDRLKQHARED